MKHLKTMKNSAHDLNHCGTRSILKPHLLVRQRKKPYPDLKTCSFTRWLF